MQESRAVEHLAPTEQEVVKSAQHSSPIVPLLRVKQSTKGQDLGKICFLFPLRRLRMIRPAALAYSMRVSLGEESFRFLGLLEGAWSGDVFCLQPPNKRYEVSVLCLPQGLYLLLEVFLSSGCASSFFGKRNKWFGLPPRSVPIGLAGADHRVAWGHPV